MECSRQILGEIIPSTEVADLSLQHTDLQQQQPYVVSEGQEVPLRA